MMSFWMRVALWIAPKIKKNGPKVLFGTLLAISFPIIAVTALFSELFVGFLIDILFLL